MILWRLHCKDKETDPGRGSGPSRVPKQHTVRAETRPVAGPLQPEQAPVLQAEKAPHPQDRELTLQCLPE